MFKHTKVNTFVCYVIYTQVNLNLNVNFYHSMAFLLFNKNKGKIKPKEPKVTPAL